MNFNNGFEMFMYILTDGAIILFGAFSIILGIFAAFYGIIRGISDTFDEKYRIGKHDPEAVTSWFFGPCMLVFPFIFRGCFQQIARQVRKIVRIWVAAMRPSWILKVLLGPIGALLIALQWPVGALLSIVFSLLFSIIFFVFLLIFYILFIPVFIIDRLALLLSGFRNHCPNCNEMSIVPQYLCPHCGKVHKHLIANKYGISNHRCLCGCYMGSTYLSGKSKYTKICPRCGEVFGTIATVPLTLQLVGGTSAGKTVFTAALLEEINSRAKKGKIKIKDVATSREFIQELQRFSAGTGDPAATQGRDVTFYSEILQVQGNKPIKLEMVDIPGEMFAGEVALQEGIHRMAQYNYADGFLFLVDPFADGDLVNQQPRDGTQVSPISPSEVLHSFDQYLIAQKFAKTNQMITKPISIVVVKADTAEVKKDISIEMIKQEYNANPGLYKNSFDTCRDEMVKQYLASIGQNDLVNNVLSRYKNVHFFLSSAMGHAPNGGAYKPSQVYESAAWIIKESKPNLYQRLSKAK